MSDHTPRTTTAVRPVTPGHQPFEYPLRRPFVEPDWRRIPGYRDVMTPEAGVLASPGEEDSLAAAVAG